MDKKIDVIYLELFILALVLTVMFFVVYTSITNRIDKKTEFLSGSEWECEEILYPYEGLKYPIVMKNADYRNNYLIEPTFNSWFCDKENKYCIADLPKAAYEEYCFKWTLVKRANPKDLKFMQNVTLPDAVQ